MRQPSLLSLHSWVQYFISILFWPLSFWTPSFTVAKWQPWPPGGPLSRWTGACHEHRSTLNGLLPGVIFP